MEDTSKNSATNSTASNAEAAPAGLSRRALLRGAGTAAVPTIVTLYSGAALARSSNLISGARDGRAEGSRYRCLDTSSVFGTSSPNVYDLGTDPMAHVTRIRSDRTYYKSSSTGQPTTQTVQGPQMCTDGGKYYRKDYYGNLRQVQVRRGVLVSATALSSFANDVTYTDV